MTEKKRDRRSGFPTCVCNSAWPTDEHFSLLFDFSVNLLCVVSATCWAARVQYEKASGHSESLEWLAAKRSSRCKNGALATPARVENRVDRRASGCRSLNPQLIDADPCRGRTRLKGWKLVLLLFPAFPALRLIRTGAESLDVSSTAGRKKRRRAALSRPGRGRRACCR